jgi:hypothetical protein
MGLLRFRWKTLAYPNINERLGHRLVVHSVHHVEAYANCNVPVTQARAGVRISRYVANLQIRSTGTREGLCGVKDTVR